MKVTTNETHKAIFLSIIVGAVGTAFLGLFLSRVIYNYLFNPVNSENSAKKNFFSTTELNTEPKTPPTPVSAIKAP